MKISINTLRYYKNHYQWSGEPAPEGAAALVEKIGAQLGAVEETERVGDKYQGVVVAAVKECRKHPDADKLNVCLIDDGGIVDGVERTAEGLVQVVCGAPNVRQGLVVAWLPPGATVPESVSKDPFVLGTRELRGIVSNGMLASPRELAIGDSHEGILEIEGDAKPGTAFDEAFNLRDDLVLDIENKMFTHRPDCFGWIGVAREIAGIQGQPFVSPNWYRSDASIPAVEAEPLMLTVRNELPELVKRFCMVAMRDVKVGPSPVWLQVELAKLGQRPINNIVDYTNYFMLLTGQPLHAYDYDKVRSLDGSDGATIVVRHPKPGEAITLLNGKDIEPRAEAIMIASESTMIGVGGVMGGSDTEVDEHTTAIIIEAANFDMYSIRRTSMAHGLFTDAVTRFNKGQSPLQNRAVIAKIVNEIRSHAGGKVASELIDDVNLPAEVLERNALHAPVQVNAAFVNERLGLQLPAVAMATLLRNVEFEVGIDGNTLVVKAPFWRTDIEIPEDVVEEVGRLYGYDRLPLVLPARDLSPTPKDATVALKTRLRHTLSRAGANEVLTYSFVHGKLLEKVGQDPAQAYKLSNALSPDLQYYRLNLTPSLLDKVHGNIKAGYGEFALFEIGKAHVKGHIGDDGLPREFEHLALVYAADPKHAARRAGAAYYQVRAYLEHMMAGFGLQDAVQFVPLDNAAAPYYESGRAATVLLNGQPFGRIGEYRAQVRKNLKLPAYCAGFELDCQLLLAATQNHRHNPYRPLSRYPKVEQDITLRVAAGTPFAGVQSLISDVLKETIAEDGYFDLIPLGVYQPEGTGDKHMSFRLSVASYDKTLRDQEVAALLEKVAAATAASFHTEQV